MPYLFLSPSTQEKNEFISGGSEAYWMNRIADAMTPYLHAAGINVTRNTPRGTAVTAIRQSNLGSYDFHLALHSNAAPGAAAGTARYCVIFYYPGSAAGARMAELLADNLREVYPLPDRVRTESNAAIGELRRVRAPAAFVELGFHDNPDDAAWITNNIASIARALARSVTEYFALPFLTPGPVQRGTASLSSGALNQRGAPNPDAPILQRIPNGATVQIYGADSGWSSVAYNGTFGWVRQKFLRT